MKYLVLITLVSIGCLIYLVSSSVPWGSLSKQDNHQDQSQPGDDPSSTLPNDPSSPAANTTGASQANAPELVLMKFGAPWCPPCRMVDKELSKLKRGSLPVEIRKINVDKNPALARKYNVNKIPRLILLADGEIVGDELGFQSAQQLTLWIKRSSPDGASARKTSGRKKSVVQSNPFVE